MNLKQILAFMLFCHALMISNAYYASSVIKISSKSLNTAAALREAAQQVLNAVEPGKDRILCAIYYVQF